MVFDAPAFDDHEQVTYVTDEETGLRAIISVHDTTLGPALGGTRLREYDSPDAALHDVLRLSSAMTAKAAAADLDLGGGKAVILGSPAAKTPELLRAYGRAVDDLGGKYITAVDVNTAVADMDLVAEETEYVAGTSDGLGDPSPVTAHGAMHAMRACVEFLTGRDSLAETHVAIQGLGKVGRDLAAELAARDATLTVTDTSGEAMDAFCSEYDARAVEPREIYGVDCDIFAPCAIGGVINDDTIGQLQCNIVAGVANNVLADETRHAHALDERGIIYAPDYIVNAGGLITVAKEPLGGTRAEAFEEAARIYDRLLTMLEESDETGETVLAVSRRYVEQRLADGSGI